MNEVAKHHFNEGVRHSLESDTEAFLLHFREALALGEKAVAEYDLALNIDPDNRFIWQAKGYALRQSGELINAGEIFEKLIELSPNEAENHYQLSLCFFEYPFVDQAIEIFRNALNLSVGSQLLHRLEGDLKAIVFKTMYFAHDCRQMGALDAFQKISSGALDILDGGLKIIPGSGLLTQVQKIVLDDIHTIQNIQ